jgi:serine/threonine-protein kinase Chk1
MGILNVDADSRLNISQIRKTEWFLRPQPMLTDGRCNNPAALAERMKSKINLAGESIVDESPA